MNMQVVLHQEAWAFIELEVLSAITPTGFIEVSPVPPLGRDPRPSTGKLRIELSEQDAEQIIDGLLNVFCDKGLQPDDEPNSLGLYIEGLIDTFNNAQSSAA